MAPVTSATYVAESEVFYKDGITWLKKTGKPFTGVVIARYENDGVFYKLSYQDGVRKGDWYIKVNRRATEEGTYIDCDPDLVAFIKKETGSDSCTLNLWREAWREGFNNFVTLEIKSHVVFDDDTFFLIYTKYLKKYKGRYAQIIIYDGNLTSRVARSFP
ncbi:hypothetical protein GFS24_26530 [Chitinophaga sp. SYP-B3965]|uniref:hypothetical protein n=1 Tax=Chitinophaga sp. SYP-B3965 TaxID=2663120 RepID=UPI001299CC8A|nr:hypothetical protein [Chitinophaga sp. SYP-B3965]MRG48696.1 hypothetical protein [Chitinophaga sp. SYP-B3965]